MAASPFPVSSSGGRIRTSDLRVMSPTSYQTALPRDQFRVSSRAVAPLAALRIASCLSLLCRLLFYRQPVVPYINHTPLSINIYLSQSNALVDILCLIGECGVNFELTL